MKVGLSTYSLSRAINANEMDVFSMMEWIKEHGGEHVEIVPIGFDVADTDAANAIADKAANVGLEISSYTIGGNLVHEDSADVDKEIKRLQGEVDIAAALGVSLMRHDVVFRPIPETSLAQYLKDLDVLVPACRAIADYAADKGITTSIENHGYHYQGSERVQQLILAVDRPNFKTTLDVGNFLCVDEDPVAATQNNMPFASMVHIKDFFIREDSETYGDGWFPSKHGRKLRGAIAGFGDIDMPRVFKAIKDSGYDDYLSLEYEGKEECREGCKIGMANMRQLWNTL